MRIHGLLAAALFLSVAVAGCHIEEHNGDEGGGKHQVCSSFCDRLLLCGSIDGSQYSACTSQCAARYDDDEDNTRDGCNCVALDSCKPVNQYSCPGAPLPSGGPATGQGGSSQGGSSQGGNGQGSTSQAGNGQGSTSQAGSSQAGSGQGGGSQAGAGGTTGGGFSCSINQDCASNEDCIEQVCRSRCKASCQCHTGEVCDGGYCLPPTTPPTSCQSDCDCAAGQSCLGGACSD